MSDMMVKVHYQGERLPQKPRVTLWHWIQFYVYNLARKPMVRKRQRELKNIALEIGKALEFELLQDLFTRLATCPDCRNAYMALKPQIFVSQIHLILKQMRCEEHAEPFERFLARYSYDFQRSEDIARWINGFSK